ncbi:MAG: nicotinamide riboside transporter PnuC [Sphingobacteriales bacterium]|nr:MAG: nicotinamide riboside transporter PnuC [Sphingobacteriales bacterium]TAF81959.1 MAG: nicotinamide riboside transporter PnuC [Sphingobacteriales bacterium]
MFNHILIKILHQFIAITPLEWLGTITGLACVYLAVKQHILTWPISIISVLTYFYIFYDAKLYGDAILQLYFFVTALYGWYYWSNGKILAQKSPKKIVKITSKQWLFIFITWFFLNASAGFLLSKYTDTDVPYLDGLCTITSFIAQFLMTRKKLENWLIWIIVDLLYIPLYIHKNLLATAMLYLVFVFIALKGYLDWKKEMQKWVIS